MSQRERERERQRHMADQRRANVEQTQQSAAVQKGLHEQQTAKNPEFLERFTDVDPNTDLYDWVEDELGPAVASVHALGNRSEEYGFEQRLLNRNMIERMITERTPGRQLRQHPKLNYLAQRCRGLPKGARPEQDPDYRAPLSDTKRRILREASEAITAHQSRSQEAMGADKVSTVQTESRTIQEDNREETGVAGRISGGLFG